jgi:hypothetical protein
MKSTIAARFAPAAVAVLLGVPAAAADSPAASASPSPAASHAAPAATLSTIKPMTEDKRVKTEDIDSVMQDKNVFFLDVREPGELEQFGSYEGYVNIPMSQLEARLSELPKDRPILTA